MTATTTKIIRSRLPLPSLFEKELRTQGFQKIAGVDEAGRGPLAGPVVAAACIIKPALLFEGINDSKKLSPEKREQFFALLTEQTTFGVGIVSHEEIDQRGIVPATHLAMRQALAALSQTPDYVLVDGPKISFPGFPSQGIIKGDGLEQLIAAASIIAKVTRDRLMQEFHELYPQYDFASHKGYGTEKHLRLLEEFGPCPIHRKSFTYLSNK